MKAAAVGRSCSGACCAVFYLPLTLRDFGRRVAAGVIEDGEYILDMLIPLTVEKARERAAKFGGVGHITKRKAGHHFTCRHWDEETRRCKEYAKRPRMCREYPYGDDCSLGVGCGYVLPPKALVARVARMTKIKVTS